MHVEIRNLLKIYKGVTAVDIPFLAIPGGESIGLVGNNGAGKTTLIRLILDLVRPDRGKVFIDGMQPAKTVRWKRITAVYLGEEFLVPFLTPMEYFYFIGDAYSIPHPEIDQRLDLLRSFIPNGQFGTAEKYIRDLSDGNKQKTGIAGALLSHPRLLIFDEPFLNLDPSAQSLFKNILNQKRIRQETTVIISSHNLTHITEICDRIIVLEAGKVAQDMVTTEETPSLLAGYFDRAESEGR